MSGLLRVKVAVAEAPAAMVNLLKPLKTYQINQYQIIVKKKKKKEKEEIKERILEEVRQQSQDKRCTTEPPQPHSQPLNSSHLM